MKTARFTVCLLVAPMFSGNGTIHAQVPLSTAFTYQGYLKESGAPLNGLVDFDFRLWDAASGGSPVGSAVQIREVDVVNGLFTVQIDFGSDVFDGDARWLEIAVTFPSGGGVFTTLSPRQPLTATPYALQTRGLFVDSALNVGVGTTTPAHALHVESAGANAVFGENTSTGGIGVHGLASAFTGGGFAVYGENYSSGGVGVFGMAAMGSGLNYGVCGQSQSDTGIGVYGLGNTATGTNYGIFGKTNSSDGWAGYFDGRGYFSGDVGIGTTSPTASLEVTNSGGQHGIYAYTNYVAVRGIKTGSGTFPGVEGQTESTSSGASGVRGQVTSTSPGADSAGVYGTNAGTGGNGYGIRGTHAGSGAGVYGSSSAGPGGRFVGAENGGTTAAVEIVSGGQTMLLDGNEIDALASGLYLNNNSGLNVNIANGGGDVVLAGGGGGVGIRTTNIPAGVALAVDGKVLCEELEVQLSQDWPDYVFEQEYKLMPLSRLEEFVRAHKHLPGVSSADRIASQGLPIGKMQATLLEKVEELTLHVIDLNERLQTVQSENEALRARVQRIESRSR